MHARRKCYPLLSVNKTTQMRVLPFKWKTVSFLIYNSTFHSHIRFIYFLLSLFVVASVVLSLISFFFHSFFFLFLHFSFCFLSFFFIQISFFHLFLFRSSFSSFVPFKTSVRLHPFLSILHLSLRVFLSFVPSLDTFFLSTLFFLPSFFSFLCENQG